MSQMEPDLNWSLKLSHENTSSSLMIDCLWEVNCNGKKISESKCMIL